MLRFRPMQCSIDPHKTRRPRWHTSIHSGFWALRPRSCLLSLLFSRKTSRVKPRVVPLAKTREMVRIITIEREFGSGAAGIARLLAERLSWKLWDQRLTKEIARLAQCDQAQVAQREERMDPLYYRLL